jgi:hypothetical protein
MPVGEKKEGDAVPPKFFEGVAQIIENARKHVGRTVDLTMCISYFEIGRMIVEEEQRGSARAEYGKELVEELSAFLSERFGKGFSAVNLRNARKFFLTYAPSVLRQTTVEDGNKNGQSVNYQLKRTEQAPTQQSLTVEAYPFKVSWTHYVILMRIENEEERRFYETEAANEQWSVRQLQRQYNSCLYERLALSRNKTEVMRLANEGQTIEKPSDLIKNPYVL